DVAERRGNLRGNIVLPEMLDPILSGPRGDNGPISPEIRRHMARWPLGIEPGHFRLAQFSHGAGHPRRFIRRVMHVNPTTICALVQRDRDVLVQPLGEHWRWRLRAAPMLWHRNQRRLGPTSMGTAAATIPITCDLSRHHCNYPQPACKPVGKRHAHEYWPFTVAWLFIAQAK